MTFDRATHEDFLAIVRELPAFWSSTGPGWRTLQFHYPFLVHEFGDTAFVLREDGRVVAYLFGFISQTEPVGYIHLVGVRSSHQRRGIGRALYEHFGELARKRGCVELKAVTAPFNTGSQAFHTAIGFGMVGEPGPDGVPVHTDYHGPGEDMIILRRGLGDRSSFHRLLSANRARRARGPSRRGRPRSPGTG